MITLDKRIKDLRSVIDRAKKSYRSPEASNVSAPGSGLLDSSMSSHEGSDFQHLENIDNNHDNEPQYTEISFKNPQVPTNDDKVQELRKVLSKTRKNFVRQPASNTLGPQLNFSPELKQLVCKYQQANKKLWRLTKP